jgi:hypothetical protein
MKKISITEKLDDELSIRDMIAYLTDLGNKNSMDSIIHSEQWDREDHVEYYIEAVSHKSTKTEWPELIIVPLHKTPKVTSRGFGTIGSRYKAKDNQK